MPDGKVIQLPSTHDLGDNFAKAFDVKYLSEENEMEYAWQTCYGPAISRIYGAMISIHGDDKGLRLPYKIAPYQVVIVPIFREKTKDEVLKYCRTIESDLHKAGIRVYLDDCDQTPGWKFNYWEMKGVPIRIEAGPRDIKNNQVVVLRRDTMKRENIDLKSLKKEIKKVGKAIDQNLRDIAESRFEDLIVDADSISAIDDALGKGKIARTQFCTTEMAGLACDEEIKDKTGGEVRGTRTDVEDTPSGVCVVCGKVANDVVYIARSY
jgi:prolyl-tRNA synthetase